MLRLINVTLDYGRLRAYKRSHYTGNKAPVFGWAVLSDISDSMQSECRVIFKEAGLVIWDSGWVKTAEQSLKCQCGVLPEGVKLNVEIQIKDNHGNISEIYSDYFYNALVDWKAPWIAIKEPVSEKNTYFRKEFIAKDGLKDACLYACGLGYQQLFINGELLDGAKMDPAFTEYSVQCQYVMYPGIEELLINGSNCVAANIGGGWRTEEWVIEFKKTHTENTTHKGAAFLGPSEFTAMLRLTYEDGTTEWIYTDDSWQAGFGAYEFASIYNGTIYDARQDAAGWNKPGFEGNFANAILIGPPSEIDGIGKYSVDWDIGEKLPDGSVKTRMKPMVLNPIYTHKLRKPIAVWPDGDDTVIIDFGQNLAGVARVELPDGLTAGQKLHLRFTEELTEDGRLFRDTLRTARAEDFYIASGDARDLKVWEVDFTYHGFRYAAITGLGSGFDAMEHIVAVEMHTDLETNGSFRCGNALVTKIHEACVETERGNMHSILTDCPQRDERMGWMNDATVRFEETPYNFEIGRMFPKLIQDLIDRQAPDGGISFTAPSVCGITPTDPVCASFLIAGYQAAMHTGNTDIVRDAYVAYEEWEKCVLNMSDEYICSYSLWGDWAGPLYACEIVPDGTPGCRSAVTPGAVMSTGYSYFNCVLLAKFAEWLNKPEKVAYYNELAGKIRDAFLAKWFDPETGIVATGSHACQTFPLWLGIIPEEYCAKVAKVLHDDLVKCGYNFTTGNLCTRYLMDVLSKFGYLEDAWKVITKETCPSFGFMLQQEATTIWERFELMTDPSMNSHNHPMYAAVDYWMFAYLAGVKPAERGWTEFEVEPYMPEDLQYTHAVVDTCKGQVSVRWVKRYGRTHLQVNVPFGCHARVKFMGKETIVGSGFHTFHE